MKENLTANAFNPHEMPEDVLVDWVRQAHNPEADPSSYDLSSQEGRTKFIEDNWRKKDQGQ